MAQPARKIVRRRPGIQRVAGPAVDALFERARARNTEALRRAGRLPGRPVEIVKGVDHVGEEEETDG